MTDSAPISAKTIALIGYRGSGKTTIGKMLAERRMTTFVDLDSVVSASLGTTITNYFSTHGEAAFRDQESESLAAVLTKPPGVLATGGGVILRQANRKLLDSNCFVVWLNAPAEWLWQNIQADPSSQANRPNLTARSGLDEVNLVLKQREETYRNLAQIIVDATLPPTAVMELIDTALGLPS